MNISSENNPTKVDFDCDIKIRHGSIVFWTIDGFVIDILVNSQF